MMHYIREKVQLWDNENRIYELNMLGESYLAQIHFENANRIIMGFMMEELLIGRFIMS
jgi:hypothetical protein